MRTKCLHLLLLFTLVIQGALNAQIDACSQDCRTDLINISTGYDHINNGLLPTGAYDAVWTVVETPNPALSVPRPAYVVTPHPSWLVSPNAKWLSVFPIASFNQNNSSPNVPPYGFEMCFCVCDPESQVTIDLAARSDDLLTIHLEDLSDSPIGPNPLLDINYGFAFNMPPLVTSNTLVLAEGTYCLRANLRNSGGIAMGVQIEGSISGSGLASVLCCDNSGAVTGQKYHDQDCDGVKDAQEPGLPGWEIRLCDVAGQAIQTVFTDAGGFYSFNDVPPGTYTVKEINQPGWQPGNPANGQHSIAVGELEVIGGLDFGNCESECGAIINDSIPGYSCELPGQSYNYIFNFENATPYNVTSVVINGITPAGTTISPQFFNYYFSPIPANGGISPTETVNIQLPGPITAPTTVCFDVIYLTDTTECCHYEHCITLEPLDPCELVEVQALETEVDCCYEIGLFNNFCPDYFTGIQTELLTPGISFDAYGGTGWTATPNGSETVIDWTQTGSLPLGALNNIGFCFKDILSTTQVPQQVAVHWLALDAAGEQVIVCSDTLEFNCEPCLSITGEVLCDDNGGYVYNFTITNNDPIHTASLIVFESHTAGVSFVPASIPVSLAPNNSYTGSVVITGGTAGQIIDFKVLLFDPSGWCCHLDDVMLTLPDCGGDPDPDPCDCGDLEEFNQAIQAGFSADRDCDTGIAMLIANALEACDRVSWRVTNTETNETITGVTDGTSPFFFDFIGNVTYAITMVVTRLDENNQNCFPGNNGVFNGNAFFDCLGPIAPGPVTGIVLHPVPAKEFIKIYAPEDGQYDLSIFDTKGQLIHQSPAEMYHKQGFNMSINGLTAGIYLLKLEHFSGRLYQEKFVKMD